MVDEAPRHRDVSRQEDLIRTPVTTNNQKTRDYE